MSKKVRPQGFYKIELIPDPDPLAEDAEKSAVDDRYKTRPVCCGEGGVSRPALSSKKNFCCGKG